MDNSLPEIPESPRETTESFKNAAKQVVKGLGLTFVTDTPTANSESTTPQSSRNDEEYDTFKKNMREQMLAQGISEEAIAQAEKFSDLRREFVQEALKIKREHTTQFVLPSGIVGSDLTKKQVNANLAEDNTHIPRKIHRENLPEALLKPGIVGSDEAKKYYNQAEQTIAEMLKMREQSHKTDNSNTDKNKPD